MFRPTKTRLQFLRVPENEIDVFHPRFSTIEIHCDSASCCTSLSFVAKRDCPSRVAAFAPTTNAVSAALERVVSLLEHSVNVGFPFDCFVRQFCFVGRQIRVTILSDELFSQRDRFRLCQSTLLGISDDGD